MEGLNTVAHHKRGKPKSRRAGCLQCKPHKHQRAKDTYEAKPVGERNADAREQEQHADVHESPWRRTT